MSQLPPYPPLDDLGTEIAGTDTLVTRVTYKLFMVMVMLLALVLGVIFYFAPIPRHTRDVLYLINFINSVVLLFDFAERLLHAPKKWAYFMPWGLLDLIGSLPGIPWLRLFRLPWLITTLRELRHTTRRDILDAARSRLAESTLLSGIIVLLFVVTVGAAAIVWVEAPVPGSNIKNGGDAVWFAIVTISTVGYGDFYPITLPGRTIGAVMIVVGVGIFSVFTGYISTQFLARHRRGPTEVENQLRHLTAMLEAQRQQAAADRAALEQQIAELRGELKNVDR